MKRLSESIWSNINKRSEGTLDRQEDIIGNIKELKPVDLGGSILWADRDFQIDGNFWFTYN